VREDGKVVCRGGNGCEQYNIPWELENVVSISCGMFHTAAITAEGIVVCWGENICGQCAVTSFIINVVSVSCGINHTIVASQNGVVDSWGLQKYNLCEPPSGPDIGAISVGAGSYHN
jgi:alpha-tubulin suppressor-like RCC1 family protein